jgi:F0F1-type ATP synthase membrane subunit b/b'
LKPSSASLTTIVKRSINFLLTNLLILEYITDELTSIFFDKRGTEIDASLDNSDKICKSKLSIFTVQNT